VLSFTTLRVSRLLERLDSKLWKRHKESIGFNDKGQMAGTEVPVSTTKITRFPGVAGDTRADRPWKLGYTLAGANARYLMTLSSDYKRIDLDLDDNALVYVGGKCVTFAKLRQFIASEKDEGTDV